LNEEIQYWDTNEEMYMHGKFIFKSNPTHTDDKSNNYLFISYLICLFSVRIYRYK